MIILGGEVGVLAVFRRLFQNSEVNVLIESAGPTAAIFGDFASSSMPQLRSRLRTQDKALKTMMLPPITVSNLAR